MPLTSSIVAPMRADRFDRLLGRGLDLLDLGADVVGGWRGLLGQALTSVATTAKPRPASPARAASMVAFSASRLVWLAMLAIRPTTSPIFWRASASARTMPSVRRASSTACPVILVECATCRAISAIDDDNSSAAVATVWTPTPASSRSGGDGRRLLVGPPGGRGHRLRRALPAPPRIPRAGRPVARPWSRSPAPGASRRWPRSTARLCAPACSATRARRRGLRGGAPPASSPWRRIRPRVSWSATVGLEVALSQPSDRQPSGIAPGQRRAAGSSTGRTHSRQRRSAAPSRSERGVQPRPNGALRRAAPCRRARLRRP